MKRTKQKKMVTRSKALTPTEFTLVLQDLLSLYKDDPERSHIAMDDAMVTQLRHLGFGQSVKVFLRSTRHYS